MKIENGVIGCLSPIEGSMLSHFAAKCDPKNTIVNIGCYKGRSLEYITSLLQTIQFASPSIIGIDIKLREELHRLGLYSAVDFIEGSSWEVIDQIPDNIELVFIDGDHSYNGCTKDLELYWAKIIPNGIMIVHDVFDTSGKHCEIEVTRAFNDFVKRHQHEFVPDNWYLGPVHRIDSCAIIQKINI